MPTIQPIGMPPDADTPPDGPTLAMWRAGLDLWMRKADDGATVSRLTDVKAAVQKLADAGSALGKVAYQQLEYENFVHLDRLLQIRAAFGFSEDECRESLWRAARVASGDLSGTWPPAAA